MIIKHYYYFNNKNFKKLNKDNWDELRTSEEDSPFTLEKNRKEYEKNCEKREDYIHFSNEIINIVKKNRVGLFNFFLLVPGKEYLNIT